MSGRWVLHPATRASGFTSNAAAHNLEIRHGLSVQTGILGSLRHCSAAPLAGSTRSRSGGDGSVWDPSLAVVLAHQPPESGCCHFQNALASRYCLKFPRNGRCVLWQMCSAGNPVSSPASQQRQSRPALGAGWGHQERQGWLQELGLSGAGGDPGRRLLQQAEGEGPPGQLGLRGMDRLEEHGRVRGVPLGPGAPRSAGHGAPAAPDQPLSPEPLRGLHGRHPEPDGQGPLQLLHQGVPLPA